MQNKYIIYVPGYVPNGIMYLEDQICITYWLLMIGGQQFVTKSVGTEEVGQVTYAIFYQLTINLDNLN